MPITIGSNILSLRAQKELAKAGSSVSQNFERLSSGMRINRASDDAAGLAIATTLNSDSRVYTQAIRNVNDGLSLLAIAEGALRELSTITIRQKELAEQAANGSYSLQQRKALNTEMNALVREFNRIVESTSFNGTNLIDQSLSSMRVQAGYGEEGSVAFSLGQYLGREVGTGSFSSVVSFNALRAGIDSEAYNFRSLDLVDMNGDGHLDIVAVPIDVTVEQSKVNVLISNGQGGYTQYQDNFNDYDETGSLEERRGAAYGDFNGDGLMDMVGISSDGSEIITYENAGSFNFNMNTFASGGTAVDVVAADFNNDGKLDLFVSGSGSVKMYAGYGNGSFASAVTVGTGTSGIRYADVNNDGIGDLVSDTHLMIGSSDGSFKAGVALNTGGAGIEVGDLNGDGNIDIISDQTIRLGNGDGTFKAATAFNSGTAGFKSFDIGDINLDGYDDIVSMVGGGTTEIFISNGDGTFRQSVTGGWGDMVTVGDFNGDGVPDVISASKDFAAGSIYAHFSATEKMSTTGLQDITTAQGALEALTTISAQLSRITSELGNIGSSQSRLEVAVNNLLVSRENFDAAASRIVDADIAVEASELIRNSILQQAASAVLSQANLQPALAVRLLSSE